MQREQCEQQFAQHQEQQERDRQESQLKSATHPEHIEDHWRRCQDDIDEGVAI
jgi:hypothetical protein